MRLSAATASSTIATSLQHITQHQNDRETESPADGLAAEGQARDQTVFVHAIETAAPRSLSLGDDLASEPGRGLETVADTLSSGQVVIADQGRAAVAEPDRLAAAGGYRRRAVVAEYAVGQIVIADQGAGPVVVRQKFRHVTGEGRAAISRRCGGSATTIASKYQRSVSSRPALKRSSQAIPGRTLRFPREDEAFLHNASLADANPVRLSQARACAAMLKQSGFTSRVDSVRNDPALDHISAAVDRQGRAGDEAGVVADQEEDAAGDFVGLADAARRGCRRQSSPSCRRTRRRSGRCAM